VIEVYNENFTKLKIAIGIYILLSFILTRENLIFQIKYNQQRVTRETKVLIVYKKSFELV